jgi:L-iditol 2-dehydrogenase
VRAVLQHAEHDVRLADRPRPALAAGEVLLHTRAVTICASDIHIYAEGNVGGVSWDRPFVPGHEAAGVVEDPNGSGLAPGTPVVIDPAIPCRKCPDCKAGNSHLCKQMLFSDLPPLDGAMQEFLAWPASLCFPVPEAVDVVTAPLIEPLTVGVHATELCRDLQGAVVAVAGCGAVGLFTIQMARHRGAKTIIASDLLPERLALAKQLGAAVTVRVGEGDLVAAAHAATRDRGVDVAFEAAGPPEAVQQCLEAARPGGEVIIIGIPSEDVYTLQPSHLRRHELTIRFCRRQNGNYPEAISLVREGKVVLDPILTHRFPVERVSDAFALAERKAEGAVRVAIVFEESKSRRVEESVGGADG